MAKHYRRIADKSASNPPVWASVLVLVGAFALTACQATTNENAPPISISQLAPAVQEPQVQEPQTNFVVPPVNQEIKVRWTSIGRTKSGNEVLALPIPKLIGTGPGELGRCGFFAGRGDGVAFFGVSATDRSKFWFTPDNGATCYKLANEPLAQFTTSEHDVGFHGTFLDGGALTLFMYAQVEPWVYQHWRADVPLSQLIKGPSP